MKSFPRWALVLAAPLLTPAGVGPTSHGIVLPVACGFAYRTTPTTMTVRRHG